MKAITAPMTEEMLEVIASRFRLLGEPARLRLLHALEQGDRTVGELTEQLRGSQPNISRHLNALFEGGLVARRREGNTVCYSIADPMIFKVCELMCASAREQIRMRMELMVGRPARARRGSSS